MICENQVKFCKDTYFGKDACTDQMFKREYTNMPSTSITFGGLLILIGIIGYVYGLINGSASVTAFIPSVFGIILVALGAAAQAKESLRKHLMHAAVIIALLGFIMPLMRILSKVSDLSLSAAVIAQVAMSLVCLIFVILSVRSFIDARRNREV